MPDAAASFIPNRHRVDRAQARRQLGTLRLLMPREVEPSAERWRAMGEGLMRGDKPMDRLMEWMFAHGMRTARGLYERALERGIAAVPEAPAPLREFFELVERDPDWLERGRLREGAEVYRRGGADLIYVARDVSLVGGYQASAFNKTLLLTGALQKGPARRFAETLRWALDCTADGGMDLHGSGYKSTLRVRLIHGLVRRHVRKLPEWRMEHWGLPINQTDMAATLLGSFAVPLLGARIMGMPQSRREREAAIHHGRYVGWLMGVAEHWLPADERSAMVLLYQLLLGLSNPDETSAVMARPMIDEPLNRVYPHFSGLRRRYDRARHLSISRLFLGRTGMRNLGFPAGVLPWYPLLKAPLNLSWHLGSRVFPGGKALAARLGRREQGALPRIAERKPAGGGGTSCAGVRHTLNPSRNRSSRVALVGRLSRDVPTVQLPTERATLCPPCTC